MTYYTEQDSLEHIGQEPSVVDRQIVDPATVVLVPDFIMRATKLHKLNVIDILNFGLISKVCSTDDLALWVAINANKYKNIRFTTPLDGMFYQADSNYDRSKFSTVESLAYTEEIMTAASQQYLRADVGPEKPFYELKSIGRTILVVVEPGFLYHLEKSDTVALDFIRDLIKATESVSSPSVAARSDIYKAFLKLTTSFVS